MKKPVWVTKWGLHIKKGSAAWKWAHQKFGGIVHGKKKPTPKPPKPPAPAPAPLPPTRPSSITMYDDTNPSLIPATAKAVAGYVNGKYQTASRIKTLFPKALKVFIAVTADADADCLDVERGDATPDQAPAWLTRQWKTWTSKPHDVPLPVIYSSESAWPALIALLTHHGFVHRKHYLIWSAHYTYHLHICGPHTCGSTVQADATQWTDKAFGRSLDETICSPDFFTT